MFNVSRVSFNRYEMDSDRQHKNGHNWLFLLKLHQTLTYATFAVSEAGETSALVVLHKWDINWAVRRTSSPYFAGVGSPVMCFPCLRNRDRMSLAFCCLTTIVPLLALVSQLSWICSTCSGWILMQIIIQNMQCSLTTFAGLERDNGTVNYYL